MEELLIQYSERGMDYLIGFTMFAVSIIAVFCYFSDWLNEHYRGEMLGVRFRKKVGRMISIGVFIVAIVFVGSSIFGVVNGKKGISEYGEDGVFVSQYGFLDSEVSDGKVQIKIYENPDVKREVKEIVVKEVDHTVKGCMDGVYALQSNGELWVCEQE